MSMKDVEKICVRDSFTNMMVSFFNKPSFLQWGFVIVYCLGYFYKFKISKYMYRNHFCIIRSLTLGYKILKEEEKRYISHV